jgi:hypothetical protein
MVEKGKVNQAGLEKFLQREVLTDQSLAAYGQTIGVGYRLGLCPINSNCFCTKSFLERNLALGKKVHFKFLSRTLNYFFG